MKYTLTVLAAICIAVVVLAQTGKKKAPAPADTAVPDKPKLVVGIVVDQMRFDYLYRYWDKFGNDGFKRLVTQGYNCRNTNYNYVPTYTGPGHASIYTGTTPMVHGIISNNWYDRDAGKEVYCAEDATVRGLGTTAEEGQRSPRKMLVTTVGDQLRLATNMQSKVIGVALKDRSSILPAGHTANAAYWYDGSTGSFISSTFYMTALPAWVQDFNAKQLPAKYLSQNWDTLIDKGAYTESLPDNNKYEGLFKGETAPVFPHELPKLMETNGKLGLIRTVPAGNTLTRNFAEATILGEQLGKGSFTDFFCVSFSSPDYIGHMYGPQSKEVEDCYLKLDMEIAAFLRFLDSYLGKNKVLAFLTADHGAVETPQYLIDNKIPAGYFDERKSVDSLAKALKREFGDTLIEAYTNDQVFLDRKAIAKKKLDKSEVERFVADFFMQFKGVANVMTATEMTNEYTQAPRMLIQNGFNFRRSGDVCIILEPGWFGEWPRKTGTTHGAPWSYDTHVPLYWWGWKIKPGSNDDRHTITDIAPSICMFLNIQFPDGCTGQPIGGMLK
jgi:predicted AlkP superfamily pyrophosphatase or phosphodiesterase